MNKYKNDLIILTRLAIILLIGLGIFVVYQMTYRSVWVDEGGLLKNILNSKSILDFINPLPHYKQAEPFTASLFFKLTTDYISNDLQSIRIVMALFSTIFILTLLSIFKKNIFGQLILLLVIFSNLLVLGYYSTEIKHYFLEILASSFMIYCIYLYNKTNKLTIPVLILSLSTLMGFSTLIPSIIIFGYFLLVEYKKNKTIFKKEILFILSFYLLIFISTYIHMKLLTIHQMSAEVYLSNSGLGSDLRQLKRIVMGVYGKGFILLAAIASIYALFVNKKSFLFNLNMIFLVIVLVVIFGRLTGVYPVISIRHLVWILPFSIVITTLVIVSSLKERMRHRYLGYFLIIGLLVKSLHVGYIVYSEKLPEDTANNNLYAYVSKMNKSTIVLFPAAQPSFEYYLRIMPDLNKHEYYGFHDSKSTKHDFSKGSSFLVPIPKNEFYYLISHSESIDDTRETYRSHRTKRVRDIFKENSCNYLSIFTDKNVQLLKVNCRQKGNHK